MKVLLNSFHLNGHTLGLHPQTQKVQPYLLTQGLNLGVKGLKYITLFQVCTFIFLTEMILKLIAFKLRGYLKSRWNIFDGIVVIISLIDTVFTLSNFIDNTGTSVLRSFRLVSISNA